MDFRPNIIHFSGHGSGTTGLLFEDETGKEQLVTGEALSGLFKECAKYVECVLLNACYSQVQAEEIIQHIDYVIGMNDEIGDKAAIEFAVGFYDALAAYDPQYDEGSPIEFAFNIACNAIDLAGIQQHLIPTIKKNPNASKKSLFNYVTPNNNDWITHDKAIFIKSDNLMSERQLLNFLGYLEATHCFRNSQESSINKFVYFFEETSNQYISEELAQSSQELIIAFQELRTFTNVNFYVFPDRSDNLRGDTQFCLQPGMNIDRTPYAVSQEKMIRYDELKEELYLCTEKIRECYKQYRLLVKKVLII